MWNKALKYGMKTFFVGFTIATIGGSLLFLKDAIINNVIHDVMSEIGYYTAMLGFLISFLGMTMHWIEFFKNIKS